MTYNANGQLMLTVVPGTSLTGLYAADGSYNVVLTTENTTWKGLQHPCGAYWGTVIPAPTNSYYAIDGSMNIVQNSNFTYSPLNPIGSTSGRTNLITNGNFLLNPVSGSQSTVLNGWEWSNNAGTGTVTWSTPFVTLTGDGTFNSNICAPITTVAGTTYTLNFDLSGSSINGWAGTTAFGSSLGSVFFGSVGTNQKMTFVATTTTSFVSFAKTAAVASSVTNVSVL